MFKYELKFFQSIFRNITHCQIVRIWPVLKVVHKSLPASCKNLESDII
jgi:hypothetical protein